MSTTLRDEIEAAINRHNAERGSDTPDLILAQFLIRCLEAFNSATNERDEEYSLARQANADREELQEAQSRADRAEAMVVWAVKHHASLYHDEPVKHINYWTDERQRGQGESECDGTDADILRAVAEAMEETESDGK